jgi:hypothetical protein
MNTHVGQTAAQDEGINLQPTQQDFKVGSEECRIPPLWNDVITVSKSHFFSRDLRASIAFETMNIFVTIKLSPEVDQVRAVHFLNENHRNIVLVGGVNEITRCGHALFVTGHIVDGSDLAIVDESAFLNVDHDNSGFALNQVSSLFFSAWHCFVPLFSMCVCTQQQHSNHQKG